MSKRYTTKEMRDMGEQILFTDDDWYEDAGHMLIQAADDYEKTTSIIESRLGRAEKRQKHELANALFECCTWTIGENPRVCNVDCKKVERIFHRLRAEADSIESEVSNV